MQLKEQQKLEKELNGYVEWICRAEDLVLAEDRTTEADRVLIMEGDYDTHDIIFQELFFEGSRITRDMQKCGSWSSRCRRKPGALLFAGRKRLLLYVKFRFSCTIS